MKASLNQQAMAALYEAMAKIDNPTEAEAFLQDLCTPSELQAMADRWIVVGPIKAGVPYREIYQNTGVSVTTVGRVARVIREGRGGYNTIYQRMESSS